MTVIKVTEDLPSGGGQFSVTAGATYTRNFIVETDTYDDNSIIVGSDYRLPAFYEHYQKGSEYDYQAVVIQKFCVRDRKAPLIWRVRVEYSASLEQGALPDPGPLTIEHRLPEVTIGEETIKELRLLDRDRNPIWNTADDWFSPMPEKSVRIKTFTVRRWTRTFANLIAAGEEWEDKLNDAEFWGFAAEKLLSNGLPTASRQADMYGTYYETYQTIRYNPKGWKLKLENIGFNEKIDPGTNDKLRRILDGQSQPVTEPQYLDAQGKHDRYPPFVDPIEFDIYELYDYNLMNLPPLDVPFT